MLRCCSWRACFHLDENVADPLLTSIFDACDPCEALILFGAVVTQVGAVVQRVCAHVMGLPKAAEVADSPLDKMFGGASDKGKSLVAMKEEAAERRRMLQRAAQEAGKQ